MNRMTTTTWVEADHTRDKQSGRFARDLTFPDISLDSADFDLATFMQEPPTTPAPLTLHQPVIYTNVNGDDEHALIVGFTEHGWPSLVTRTPGTLNDTDDFEFTVDPRYVGPDLDVSPDLVRRQTAAATNGADVARKLTDMDAAGINAYLGSLRVRDRLNVDGRGDRERTFEMNVNEASRALDDLVARDLMSHEMHAWTDVDGYSGQPQEFVDVANTFEDEGHTVARAVILGAMIDSYGPWADKSNVDTDSLSEVIDDAKDLAERMAASRTASEAIDAEVNQVTLDESDRVFGEQVRNLPVRKAASFERARTVVATAFAALSDNDLLDWEQKEWLKDVDEDEDDAKLVRAAGQAAILRHFQEETAVSDKHLDLIDGIYKAAITKWAKSVA